MVYIGVHQTSVMDDGYMGSGSLLKKDIKKYGIGNFIKDIIEYFPDKNSMYEMESKIVNREFTGREDTYNVVIGGKGGFHLINETKKNAHCGKYNYFYKNYVASIKGNDAKRLKLQNDPTFRQKWSKCGFKKEDMIKGVEAAKSPEALRKKKDTFKSIKHQQGEKNSQYGTVWVCHPEQGVRKCKKHLVEGMLSDGWSLGRSSKINLKYNRKFFNI